MKPKARRVKLVVRPTRKGYVPRGWLLQEPGVSDEWCATKAEMVRIARAHGRNTWKLEGRPAQLVVFRRDGTIEFENTYGNDPERSKG